MIAPNFSACSLLAQTRVGWLLALALLLFCAPAVAQDPLLDIDGKIHRPFENPKVRAVVLVFVVTDCPAANSYMPELNRLEVDYEAMGLRLFLVQVDPQLSVNEARAHARQHQLRTPVIVDRRHVWVRKVGATMTPEAAVLLPSGKVLYLGRIDNRYAGLGKRRETVTSHDLREVLDSIVTGRPVSRPKTPVVGCTIPELRTESNP